MDNQPTRIRRRHAAGATGGAVPASGFLGDREVVWLERLKVLALWCLVAVLGLLLIGSGEDDAHVDSAASVGLDEFLRQQTEQLTETSNALTKSTEIIARMETKHLREEQVLRAQIDKLEFQIKREKGEDITPKEIMERLQEMKPRED